ncbi:hypothetical protein EDC04DRAFT_726364 [Pisolithus marmoratus]|nr:hypothetical protein EDC04DRAFT_726364 [Pisolithus marmoratus]
MLLGEGPRHGVYIAMVFLVVELFNLLLPGDTLGHFCRYLENGWTGQYDPFFPVLTLVSPSLTHSLCHHSHRRSGASPSVLSSCPMSLHTSYLPLYEAISLAFQGLYTTRQGLSSGVLVPHICAVA